MSRYDETDHSDDNVSMAASLKSYHLADCDMNARPSIPCHEVYPGTETDMYNFADERRNVTTSIVEATFHLMTGGTVGIGMLAIHEAFMKGGMVPSIVLSVFFCVVLTYNMHLLIRCAHKMYVRLRVPKLTYAELADVALGTGCLLCCRKYHKVFRKIVKILTYLQMLAFCCIYLIMVAVTTQTFLENVSTYMRDQTLSIRIYILILTVPLILLCFFRALRLIALVSLVAGLFICFSVTATILYGLTESSNYYGFVRTADEYGIIYFCGVCVCALDNIIAALPVENNMKRPKYFHYALQIAMALLLVLLLVVGLVGSWVWGAACTTPITLHLPDSIIPTILQLVMIPMMLVKFTVKFWISFRLMWRHFGKKYRRKRRYWEFLYKLIHILCISAAAIIHPFVTNWIFFVGMFFLSFTCFIFPAMINVLVRANVPRRGLRWCYVESTLLIIIGLIMIGCGVWYFIPV